MSGHPGDLTTLFAKASEETRRRLDDAVGEASAWVEWVARGAPGAEGCVVCGSTGHIEENHVAGRSHGELVVPMCVICHRRFTAQQNGWDPRWRKGPRSPTLDESLLLRGLAELCEEKSMVSGPAYAELAQRLLAAYAVRAQETL